MTEIPAPQLTVEYGVALGVGTASPRLSWRLGPVDGWRQVAYELRLHDGDAAHEIRVASPSSVLVPWPFTALSSRQRVQLQVRAFDAGGRQTPWSTPYAVEAALLTRDDWRAQMIAPAWDEDVTTPQPACLLRREFALDITPACARLYITARGVYTAEINGHIVDDCLLAPGWSAYRRRLRYQVFDVTGLLRADGNAIGITVADGWYRGYLAWESRRNWYGTRTAGLAQLEIEDAEGRRRFVTTDEQWRAGQGPIRSADIYMGESYDARLAGSVEGWTSPGFDDRSWTPCIRQDFDHATLTARAGHLVRPTQTLEPRSMSSNDAGAVIVDFGQNLVGHTEFAGLSATAGQEIVLRHAEVLLDGELFTAPLRSAKQTDRYIAAGTGSESWQPRFTYHGFRYAEVTGWPTSPAPEQLRAVVCHSDMERTGWFHCSDELVNRLHENAVWSMRGNFVDVPTDCPQRDERLGWTGDLQVFAPSAAFLFDCSGVLENWLADLAVEQRADGGVPFVVPSPAPDTYRYRTYTAAAWGDAAVIVPWVAYERFGDHGLLDRQYPSMTRYVDACLTAHGGGINRELFQFGDWLDPAAPAGEPSEGVTDRHLVAGAYLVHSLDIVAAAGDVLDRGDEAAEYRQLATRYRKVWREQFRSPDGSLTSDSLTAHALAVCFQLLEDDEEHQRAGRRMAELCHAADFRIATGFVGTPLVCDALTSTGQLDAAYRLLLQRDCPSFLYPVTQGATTIWERWDSLKPSGEPNDSGMTSFNHYALGAVVDWLHRCVAGLAPLEPGYRALWIRPLPGGGLTEASARHVTPYGNASVSWHIDGAEFRCEIEVPPSTEARLDLPIRGWRADYVGSGRHTYRGPLHVLAPTPRALQTGADWSAGGVAKTRHGEMTH
jgi:alpha-L-rhamnosidase